jgi:hypothetical protein
LNSRVDIRDEEILLLGLCRLSFDAEKKVMLTALAENLQDWSYFTALAQKHGVSALVYNNLEELGFLRLLPQENRDILHGSLMISVSRNALQIKGASEAINLLNRENIKAVLLKGLALEISVYGNRGIRQMTDVDVLVSPDDCLKAAKILTDGGFISHPVKSVLHRPILKYIGKHLPTLSKEVFSIEIHHELFSAGKNKLTKRLYEGSYEATLNNNKVFIPRPQLFFLYLIKHLHLHEMNNESQLRLYADLAVMIENHADEIIRQDLLVLAAEAGMSEILAWKLEPLRDLWGISFPRWMNDFIDKWYNPDSINKFIFFLQSPKGNPAVNTSLLYRNTIKEIPGIHRKMLYVLGDLFPTFGFMKKRYGCRSNFHALLYYPLRLGKLWLLIKP